MKKIVEFTISFSFWLFSLVNAEQFISLPVFHLPMEEDALIPSIGLKPTIYTSSEKQFIPEFKKAHLGNGLTFNPGTVMEIPLEKSLNSGAIELVFLLNSKLPSDESVSILFAYNKLILYYRCGILYFTNGEKTICLPVYHWNKRWVIYLIASWENKEIYLFVDGNIAIPSKKSYLEKWPQREQSKVILGDFKNKLDILLDDITIFNHPLTEIETVTRYQNILTKTVPFKRNIITIPFFENPPVIDGDISENVWGKATEISLFFAHPTQKIVERESPRVFLGYDREALYIAFRSPQPEGVATEKVPRDDRKIIIEHDAFEFFFRPTMTWEHSYYQIVVNSSGSIYDGKIFDSSWNGDFVYKTQTKDASWYGEIKIPFSTFEGAGIPEAGDKWTFNVCRNFKTGEGQLSQWANTGISYHSPDKFAELRFGEKDEQVCEKNFLFQENEIKFLAEVSDKVEVTGTMIIYLSGEITPFKTVSTKATKGEKLILREKSNKIKSGIVEILLYEESSQYPLYLRMFEF